METGEPVRIGKDLYAKKLADSIEIYEMEPIENPPEITLEDKEWISRALKTYDKVYKMVCEEIPPIILILQSLEEKYCENCPKNEDDFYREDLDCHDTHLENKATCELSHLKWNYWSMAEDEFPLPEEIIKLLKEKQRLKAGE